MNEWWQSLATRERALVSAMGVMVIIAMVYFFVLEPLFSGASSYRERVQTAENNLEYMKRVAPTLKQTGGSSGAGTGQLASDGRTLISIVDRTTTQFQLKPQDVTQSGEDKLRVRFEGSSFNTLVSWFGELHTKHNVQVDATNLVREDSTAGVVNGSVTIKKSTGQ